MTTEQIIELKDDPISFRMASLLAYHCLRFHTVRNHVDGVNCADWACSLALIPEQIRWDIKAGKIKGLQNFNKLSGIQYYQEDYKF